MTTSFGGTTGNNLGTAVGKVRIEYESTGSAKAVKEIASLQASINAIGGATTKLGKQGSSGLAQSIQAEVAAANKALAGLAITGNNPATMIANAKNAGRQVSNAFISEVGSIVVQGNLIGQEFGKKLEESGKTGGHKAGNAWAGALGLGLKAGLAGAAATAAAAVAGVGYVMFKGFQRLESIDLAATKLKALGNSAADVKSVMNSALEAVKGTAFSLDQAANTAAMAISTKKIKPGDDLTKYLKEIADNAAIANTSLDDMGYYFNRVVTAGRLTGETLEMLLQKGIPVFSYLAKEMGISEAKAADLARNGEINFETFRKAMNANAGAAKLMGNSISGSLDNMKTALGRLGATILEPIFGKAEGEASSFAKAIQSVSDAVDKLGNWLSEHRQGMIDFWTVAGKAVLLFGHLVVDVVGWLLEGIGKLIEGIGHVPSAFAGIFDAFGAHGIAKNLRQASDNMTKWGQATFSAGQQVFKVNPLIDNLEENLRKWSKDAKAAAGETNSLGDAAGATGPKTQTLAEALEKLGLKSDKVNEQLKGTRAEYRKLMDELAKKGAAQDVIASVEELRRQWENGGRQIKNFADAIDSFGDSADSADSRAQKLIKSFQELGLIPDDDALAKYNEDLEEFIGWNAKGPNVLDAMGKALIRQNGLIDQGSANGRTLSKQMRQLIQDSTALVASGQASPDEAYAYNTSALTELLRRYGITDPADVQAVVNKYFPRNLFDEALKHAGDPKGALQDAFKDPVQAQLELNLLTQAKDILAQLVGPDGKLHIPTVLDTPGTPGGSPKPGDKPPGGNQRVLPHMPAQGPGIVIPKPPETKPPYIPPTGGELYNHLESLANTRYSKKHWWDQVISKPDMTFGAEGATVKPSAESLQNLISMRDDQLKALVAENPDVQGALGPLIENAQRSGKSLSQAFAEGINSNEDAVIRAILKLAGIAGDGLGHSPAKYGPLSGRGWTFYRGQGFSQAWGEGIMSQQNSIRDAASSTAVAGLQPFDDKWNNTIKDLQQFSDFGKHVFDFISNITNIGLSTAKIANDLSGGRLFPKQYVPKTGLKPAGIPLPGFNPQGWNPGGVGGGGAAFSSSLKPGAGKQDIANYIISKAMSLGYTREQADQFVVQAAGESHLDPTAFNPAGWSGIFQFDQATWAGAGGGDVQNAQQNIDNYFRLAQQRGLTPQSFTAGQQLGTQVSIGGPWHPQNAAKGHLSAAQQFAQQYLSGFSAPIGATSTRPSILQDYLPGVSSGPQAVRAAALVSQMFPGITNIGGSGARPGHEGTHDVGRAIDIMIPENQRGAGGLGDQIKEFLQANAKLLGIQYTIWRDQGQYPGGPSGAFSAGGHQDHIDVQFTGGTATFEGPVTAPQFTATNFPQSPFIPPTPTPAPGTDQHLPGQPTQPGPNLPGPLPLPGPPGTPQNPVNVALPPADSNALGTLPQLPPALAALGDPNLQRALGGGITDQQGAITSLQSIDAAIADQNRLGTPESKAIADALGQKKTALMDQFGLQEAPNMLEQTTSIVSGVTGIVGDVFGVIDQSLKTVAATKDITNTMVRGVENTQDVFNLVDKFQEYITMASKVASLAGDVMQFAGGLIQGAGAAGASGGDMGGTMAAGMALSAAGSGAQVISQALAAVNAAIDLGQEAYQISTKYLGRFLQSWLGLPGANDVKYLLDTTTGQLKAYTSENPEMKTIMNTFGKETGLMNYGSRSSATNYFQIYQGPGQDPRDTMDDAMFTVRSSGVGAFGYGD